MPHKRNAPNPRAESVTCNLGGCSDGLTNGHRAAQSRMMRALPPIVARHWFRDLDLLEALS